MIRKNNKGEKMITYVAKKPTGQIKAWSVGKEKDKVKKDCKKQIFNYLDQKRKEGVLGLEHYRLDDYKIIQVDNNNWSKEV
jgi:flagellar motor component MotA